MKFLAGFTGGIMFTVAAAAAGITTPDYSSIPLFALRDINGLILAARASSGKAVVIHADEDGYVICSPQTK